MTGPGPHLIYFADPMCSWCWGFAPAIAAIGQVFGARLPIRLVLGGLRPGTTEALTPERRESLLAHWQQVQAATGQGFVRTALERPGFVYDTDPACRAVVALRRQGMADALRALHRLQSAFYAEGRDITQADELAALAVELGADGAAMRAALDDAGVRDETWRDYAISQATGVTGFPTLIAGPGGGAPYVMVARGYERPEAVVAGLLRWFEGLG